MRSPPLKRAEISEVLLFVFTAWTCRRRAQVYIHYLLVEGYLRYAIFTASVDISRRPRCKRTVVTSSEIQFLCVVIKH